MKSHVAIYSTHEDAIAAISMLSEKKFPMEHVSLIGKADIINDNFKVKSLVSIKFAPMFFFMAVGTIVGAFAGIGKISIPFLGSLAESGSVVGGFVGFDVGLAIGALIMLVVAILVKKDRFMKSNKRMVEDQYLVVVNGSLDEVEKAEQILHTNGLHNHKFVCKDCREENKSNLSLSMA
ncbi:MAG: hypothetical protein P4L28_09725 [Paludibacteraceae bacterium]|nr:hypothetical protein [Paludibacteraceae bacterium]